MPMMFALGEYNKSKFNLNILFCNPYYWETSLQVF